MVKESSVGYREELCCYVFILFVFFRVKDLPPFVVEEYSLVIKSAKKSVLTWLLFSYCCWNENSEDLNLVNILMWMVGLHIQVYLIDIQYLLHCEPSSTLLLRSFVKRLGAASTTSLCQCLKSIPTTFGSSVTGVFIDATAIQITHNQSTSTHLTNN